MRRAAAWLAAFAALPAGAWACAGCRNPNMPVTRLEAVALRAGEIRAGLSLGATGIRVTHPAGCADPSDCSEVPVQPPHLHDQRILPGELRGFAELGLTRSLGAELQLPFRVIRTTIEYTTPEGRDYRPLDPGIHHRDETLAGFGDPWLLGRWAGALGGLTVSARAGFSIPWGRTEPNPYDLGDRGLRHQHIQFGTGTFDPVLALDISRFLGRWQWLGYAQGQAAFYENGHGFRAGTRVSGGMQAGRRIGGPLSGALGAEAMHEGPERWDGEIRQDGNLGRTEILATLSLVHSYRVSALGFSARVPVYRRIVEGDEPAGTLSSPVSLGLTLSRTFRFF